MAPWQRRARLVIAVVGLTAAVVVVREFRTRAPEAPPPAVERSDPAAIVETVGGHTLRFNRDKEEIRIDHQKVLATADGSTRLEGGVTVTTARGEKTFELKSDRALITNNESNIVLEGHVQLTDSTGLRVTGGQATYATDEGLVRVPGPVQFSRGRMSGSSVGMTYDKNQDVLVLLDQAAVSLAPGGNDGSLQLTSGSAEFRRAERLLRFERALQVVRDSRTMSAAAGVAHLAEDGETLQTLELRGGSRVHDVPTGPGSLEAMSAVNMDLRYGADGTTLEHALLANEAVVDVAGGRGQASRRISANVIDATMASNGSPRVLVARDNVQLLMPAEAGGAARTITAQGLEASGGEGDGLRAAHFTGNVQFRERGAAIDRAARSNVLDLAMTPGLASIQDARFAGAVRFEEKAMAADSAAARYLLDKGVLELSGQEANRDRPHVTHERFGVYAAGITIVLAGPDVSAKGDVKSVIQPIKPTAGGAKMPSMLKRDQIVNVTAAALDYKSAAKTATYTGNALLWQGETSIKAETIIIDEQQGDLVGQNNVITSQVLEQTTDKGTKERVRSTTTAKDFHYEEASRKATYTGDAHMNNAQGDMTAVKIELFLNEGGDELERAEAYETVTLREKTRKTTGGRLTYYSADERYVMTGAPVTVIDECARETIGRTLTFYRSTDRIVVDGSEQIRTQTKGRSQCTGS